MSEYVVVHDEPDETITCTWLMWLLMLVAFVILANELFGRPQKECFKAGDLLAKKLAEKIA